MLSTYLFIYYIYWAQKVKAANYKISYYAWVQLLYAVLKPRDSGHCRLLANLLEYCADCFIRVVNLLTQVAESGHSSPVMLL